MDSKLTQEEIEDLAIKSSANMGASRVFWVSNPKTGAYVYIDLDNPSEEAIEVLDFIVNNLKTKK